MQTVSQSLDPVVPEWEPLEFRAAMLSTVGGTFEGADEAAASALEAGADETAFAD
jgi:hypothetical protein